MTEQMKDDRYQSLKNLKKCFWVVMFSLTIPIDTGWYLSIHIIYLCIYKFLYIKIYQTCILCNYY